VTGPSASGLVTGAAVLAVGTYAFRVAGPALKARFDLAERPRELMNVAAVVLLAALVATSALLQDGSVAGVARPAGVLVGGLLAWRRAPFLVVVLAAAGTAAVLRLLGVH
jgi:branched-subunit amino acid transport protein